MNSHDVISSAAYIMFYTTTDESNLQEKYSFYSGEKESSVDEDESVSDLSEDSN